MVLGFFGQKFFGRTHFLGKLVWPKLGSLEKWLGKGKHVKTDFSKNVEKCFWKQGKKKFF